MAEYWANWSRKYPILSIEDGLDEDDWAGSHLVNNIDLAAIYFQPTVSVKLGPTE